MEKQVEILVAEDEPAVAVAIKSALLFSGYSAVTVQDGQAALERIQAEPDRFAVTLTDHNMPRMGGLALVKALREIGYPGQIVVLSAYLSRDVEAEYRALAVEEILQKPFGLERLRGAMDRALQAAACGF